MTVPALPSELTDDIIGYLHEDKQSLRSCSLVNRSWMPASSAHLFRRMRWPPCQHALDQNRRSWETLLTCRCELVKNPESLKDFISFIQSTTRARTYAQELHICFSWFGMPQQVPRGEGHGEDDVYDPSSFFKIRSLGSGRYVRPLNEAKTTPEDLIRTVDGLPSLRCLILHGEPFNNLTEVSHHSSVPMRELDKLSFSGLGHHMSPELLSAFLQHFRRIRTLAWSEPGWPRPSHSQIPCTPKATPSVDTLELGSHVTRSPCWLRTLPPMLALGSTQELNILDETGSIFIGGTLNDNDMHALIRSCTNLATLSCTTMTRPMIAAYPFPSPKPRHLRLRTRCYFGSWRSDWASCLDIVEMMHTPLTASVNTLTIDFMMEETGLPEFYSTESSEAQFRKVFTSLGWERLDCLPPNISTLYLSFNLRLARPVGDGHRRRMMAEDLVLGLISPQVREIIQTPLQIQVYSSSESGSAGAAAVKEVSS